MLDIYRSRGVIGKHNFAVGSYYLGDSPPETVSYFIVGVTDSLEFTVNQYYQENDWTVTARYGILKEGENWWQPSLILGGHDLGTPEDAGISLTGMKYLNVPYLQELGLHAGIFRETADGGDTKVFGGVAKKFGENLDFSLLHDGYDPHAIVGATYKGFRAFMIAYKMEHFGAGLSYQFGLGDSEPVPFPRGRD